MPLTTALLGAANQSQCVCGPQSFLREAACVDCTELRWFECQRTFGNEAPKIMPGYMSLRDEPLMVYSCGHERACQGIRDPFAVPLQPMCSNSHSGVACNKCETDFASRGDECIPCHAQEGESNIFDALPPWVDLVYSPILLLVTCTWVYHLSMRPPTAERLIWGMLIGFLQTFSLVGRFNVAFPFEAVHLFAIGEIFNFKLEYLGVRSECFTGTDFTMRLLARIAWPLALQIGFLSVYQIWRSAYRIHGQHRGKSQIFKMLPECVVRWAPEMIQQRVLNNIGNFWPMLSENLLNCMQRAHLGLFISVLSISFSLFDCKMHPNGRYTVEEFLDVECYSSDWWEMFPLGLASVLIYCVAFASWIVYLIWLAPYCVGTNPYFAKAYRFIWAKWHPEKWWFTLVELAVAVIINLVSTLASNAYQQIYITAIILMMYTIMLLNLQPWKFFECTRVDAVMKIAMVCFLLLATAFVDINDEDRKSTKDQFQVFLVVIPFGPMGIAIFCFLRVLWRKYYAKADSHIQRLLFAQRFRDVMTMACHMSNTEFNKLITIELCDNDRNDLVQAADVLVASVLKMQPGSGLRQRRIIPGTPYVVGTNESIDEAIIKRGIHDLPAVKERLLLHRVAAGLASASASSSPSERSTMKRLGPGLGLGSARRNSVNHEEQFNAFDVSGDGTISRTEFVDALHKRLDMARALLRPEDRLTDEEIGAVYDMMDIDGDGEVTIDEFTAVLAVATKSSKELMEDERRTPNKRRPIPTMDQAATKIQIAFRQRAATKDQAAIKIQTAFRNKVAKQESMIHAMRHPKDAKLNSKQAESRRRPSFVIKATLSKPMSQLDPENFDAAVNEGVLQECERQADMESACLKL
eukprot:gnl/MRDRNA2_/MRDRNA2_30610_c0_seq1.p1 gnl/MRDRNA2_/MRDRNA2_30610_c0~~gnl/MRDRNA2_/MRDRNA2_30610_c0_seq1.p1  ORF type:complete len:864 (+),score=113.74 gnl/MRDRNA2_/MRDRNA2_30610_c0_seq1:1-2592(+)